MNQPSDRIRVMYVAHTFGVGGAEELVLNLVRHLPHRFEPMVCAIGEPGAVGEEIRAAGVPVAALGLAPGLRRPWDVVRLSRFMRRTRPLIVHTQLLTASLYGRLAAILARVPVVVGSEHNIYRRKQRHHALAERLLMSGTDSVVAVAGAVRDFYVRQIHADPAKVVVIPNAVDWSALHTTQGRMTRDETRRSLDVPGDAVDAPLAVVIGRLSEQKGHRYLLEALARTPALGRVHAVFAGDGELRDDLRDRAAALGLASRVHIAGIRRDVGNLLQAADVFVLPSLWEGLPLALILAMGAGLPIVASRVAGVPEVIEDGRTGVLVPPADPDALGHAIAGLLADPAAARQLGANARAEALPRYGVEPWVASMVALYDRLIGQRAGLPTGLRTVATESQRRREKHVG